MYDKNTQGRKQAHMTTQEQHIGDIRVQGVLTWVSVWQEANGTYSVSFKDPRDHWFFKSTTYPTREALNTAIQRFTEHKDLSYLDA